MTKRVVIWSIAILTIVFMLNQCSNSYRNTFYESVSVLNFTKNSKTSLALEDGSLMNLYCHLDEGRRFSVFEINFKFSDVKREIIIESLIVEIIALEKNEPIVLDHVIGYKDKVDTKYFDKAKIRAKNFNQLHSICKRMSTNRDYNGLSFRFKTNTSPLSKKFRLKIKGDLVINGRTFPINKELKMLRTKEWVKIQMMT